MVDMVIPQEMRQHTPEMSADRLLLLGLRATWLRLCLERGGAAMAPLDRDLITAVALAPEGLPEIELLARMRHMSPGAAHAWLDRLSSTWLAVREVQDIEVFDLPQADRAWITNRVRESRPTLAPALV